MYELVQVGKDSFYMDCPAKVGIFRVADGEVILFDSGSDTDAAKKVKKILDANGWHLNAIYHTHSHADHIGGNAYLQGQTGCKIYAPGVERCFAEYPMLEPLSLYGGYAPASLQNKFLMAKPSCAEPLTEDILPDGVTLIRLPGHSYDMVGFRTRDEVVYLADCLSSRETLEKYQIGYLYDVKAYLETLRAVMEMKAECFVPSHAPAQPEIAALAQFNLEHTTEIACRIVEILNREKTFDELMTAVFDAYGLQMTAQQYALVGSAVKSYLTYLENEGKIEAFFDGNRMLRKTIG